MTALRSPLLAALLLACGCVVYNEECSPQVAEPDEVTGWLGGEVLTTKPEVRTKENALGQMVAEAYYFSFDSILRDPQQRPDLGLENAGAIRSEGVCESREVLRAGAVKRKVLREVLPFDDQVTVVSVTHQQLKRILEHAFASLTPTGAVSPSGAFLQVYGGSITVDCKLPAETLKPDGTLEKDGQRIRAITLHRRDGTTREIPLTPPSTTETVRIALNSYLADGGDGFVELQKPIPNANRVSSGSYNFEIIAQYFKDTYTQDHPLPAEPVPRVTLIDCR